MFMSFIKPIKMKNKGFTLTEIMIVLVVLGLLIAIALPRVSQVLDLGKENSTKTSMNSLAKAMKNFYSDTNVWPGSLIDLMGPPLQGNVYFKPKDLLEENYKAADSHTKSWKGPYMDGTTNEISFDAWNNKYAIGVVTGGDFKGYEVDENNKNIVRKVKASKATTFTSSGSQSGLYVHSYGPDGINPGTDDSAADDIFVFVTLKQQ